MSTAVVEAAPAAGGGKKKLIIIIVAALVLLLGGGGAAFMLLNKGGDAEEGEDGDGHGAHASAKADSHAAAQAPRARARDPKHAPTFVPLDAFTVNLADRENDRYAQIGITLEIDDPKFGEELKTYMPAIRNNILLVLSSRTSAQMLTREGKEKLAKSVLYAAVKPLGFPVPDEDEEADDEHADAAAEDAPKKKKKKKKSLEMAYPISAVHFSTFIVQ